MTLAVRTVGSGPRLVLVHGFTQTGRSWSIIAADLARDHEVVMVDAPGHGGSPPTDSSLWEFAAALAEVGGQATYVGYSMGGRACLHLAIRHPELVEGLVMLGATGGIDGADERAARRADDDALADEIERIGVPAFLDRWMAQPMFADIPDDRADRLTNTAAGLASSLRYHGTGTQDPLWDRLGELRMPVLVLAGERDEKFTAAGRRLAQSIGPNASLATIPDALHAAHLAKPTSFLDALRGWLSYLRGPRPLAEVLDELDAVHGPADEKLVRKYTDLLE